MGLKVYGLEVTARGLGCHACTCLCGKGAHDIVFLELLAVCWPWVVHEHTLKYVLCEIRSAGRYKNSGIRPKP